jgi:hypothetical protein
MGLSDDQKALLRLLASGQGYADIAALLGISVDAVKAKAAAAVEQLEAEGIPAPSLPGTPPPSAADPEPPSDPPPPPAHAPQPPAPEPPLKPAPADPEPPSDPPPSTRLEDRSARPQRPRPKLTIPSDPGKRAAIAAGAIVVALIAIVLIVSGGGGGGGSDSTTAATSTTSGEETGEAQNTANGGESSKLTKAVLEDVNGGEAAGVAIFGRVKKSLALQVQASGLEPSSKTDSYTVWLAQSAQKMLPLASTAVKADGRIAAQFEVPVEVIAYLANETFDQIVVTKTDDAKLQASLKEATKAEKAPTYTGEPVLAGEVSGRIVGVQKRYEEAKEATKEKKE